MVCALEGRLPAMSLSRFKRMVCGVLLKLVAAFGHRSHVSFADSRVPAGQQHAATSAHAAMALNNGGSPSLRLVVMNAECVFFLAFLFFFNIYIFVFFVVCVGFRTIKTCQH